MNKKRTIMTMLVAFALSVSALSTTAVFAEDEAIVNGDNTTVTETTTAEYAPELTLATGSWTGDNDIVFDVQAKGGKVNFQEMYIYDANDSANPAMGVEPKVELDAEGNGKITFSKDQLKAAQTLSDDGENTVAIDWTKVTKVELSFGFILNDAYKSKTMYVDVNVKAATPSTPSTPSTPATPTKPSQIATDNKGTTTSTTTKKNYPQTGDKMNVAVYASMLVMSALFITVILRKKNVNE